MLFDHSSTTQLPITIPVDAEHSNLRLAVIGIFLLGWIAIALVIGFLIPSGNLNLIAIIAGLVLAGLLTQLIEKRLKRYWPSGRIVQVNLDGVKIMLRGEVQQHIDTHKPANMLLWHFQIKRRSRVPKGWFMVACALEQENLYLPVYTFMSPAQFKALENSDHFTALTSEKNDKMENVGKFNLRLAGEQRRLRQAEDERWRNGAEMTVSDFQVYLDKLKWNFAAWLPADF